MRRVCVICAVMLVVVVTACRGREALPAPTKSPAPTETGAVALEETPRASATPVETEASPTVEGFAPPIKPEPTFTPYPNEQRTSVDELPVGQPGHYVNVTFGYWLQYPKTWYTGFGNRPLLASFSDLDPGTHNRARIRAEGCLIQVNASINVYGSILQDLIMQGPSAFPNARTVELDGEPGVLMAPRSEEDPVQSETVMISHDDVMFVLTLDYSKDSGEVCRSAWESMLTTWRWFTPEFAVYRNAEYAYAISYPRDWYRFNATDRGIYIGSQDPTGLTDLLGFMREAMLVQTSVFDNAQNLTLKEWLAQTDWDMDLTNDIPLYGQLIGVRAVGEGPAAGIRRVSGYFQGPHGEVYGVLCYYPEDREWEYSPIANAIMYSFSF